MLVLFQDCTEMQHIVEKVIKMQVFDLRSNTVLNQDQNFKDLDLVFHWVSRSIHLSQMGDICWLPDELFMSLRSVS